MIFSTTALVGKLLIHERRFLDSNEQCVSNFLTQLLFAVGFTH